MTDSMITKAMYLQKKKNLEQVCGAHFNKKGHTQTDMLPTIIEKIHPKDDTFLRLNRERFWINTYEECANKQT